MTGTLLLACCITLSWLLLDAAGRRPRRRVRTPERTAAVVPDRTRGPVGTGTDPLDAPLEDRCPDVVPALHAFAHSGAPMRLRSRRVRGRRRGCVRPRGLRPAGPRPRTARVH
ncbi:hypothetical protein GB931_21930 [Modestobacter sp. I12A-02628]|uniref:Uncharacterized protein n=1 Tax=Goekera deserti TaxID=2497753 RepID=A0A7K3WJD7_9ACTN|nr:hypothetical protein [Goekera deserti]MPR00535.1 hypothetical protein [Goekera deserti]NDI50471.1 hypothetical protein [Goekera deserti]NEL56567.1 hypothetical protein [Goekera deserti]